MSTMTCFGESILPVRFAGQAAVQRPHSVQVYVSSNCFQLNCRSSPTPNTSAFSMSLIGESTPVGS